MQRYYDAHLYLANWGTHRIMLRLPCTLLDPDVAEQYLVEDKVTAWTGEHFILELTSEDEAGDWVECAEDSLSAIAGVRSELAAGDLRSLYLAWLSAYGRWEHDEDAFDYEEEDELEPPVPAGLGSLTGPQQALADFLRLDPDLLAVAAKASPALPTVHDDPRAMAAWISSLPPDEKDTLLLRVVRDQAARVQMELLRRFRGEPGLDRSGHPRRTVAELLDGAAERRHQRERQAAAKRAAEHAHQERERALAREKRLDALAHDHETAWARVHTMISTRKPAEYDAAVEILKDLQELAQRTDHDPNSHAASPSYGKNTYANPASSNDSTAPVSPSHRPLDDPAQPIYEPIPTCHAEIGQPGRYGHVQRSTPWPENWTGMCLAGRQSRRRTTAGVRANVVLRPVPRLGAR